jgi:hypothetical protein
MEHQSRIGASAMPQVVWFLYAACDGTKPDSFVVRSGRLKISYINVAYVSNLN